MEFFEGCLQVEVLVCRAFGFCGGGVEEAVSLCRGEGEKVCMIKGWLLCCVIGRMHAYAASSMSTKRLRTGCAARSRALAVLCRGCCKEALKKGLTWFGVTMKLQVRGIE